MVIYSRLFALFAASFVGAVPSSADEAVQFGRFLGVVAAIEEACPSYYVKTDAVSGNHLSVGDLQHALSMSDREKTQAAQTVVVLGCQKAAEEAVSLVGASFFDVWTIKK